MAEKYANPMFKNNCPYRVVDSVAEGYALLNEGQQLAFTIMAQAILNCGTMVLMANNIHVRPEKPEQADEQPAEQPKRKRRNKKKGDADAE